jgi:hypothetical protein
VVLLCETIDNNMIHGETKIQKAISIKSAYAPTGPIHDTLPSTVEHQEKELELSRMGNGHHSSNSR